MKFDREQIMHLADLAKLKLSEEEIDSYNHQLQDILAYVEKINNLDLSDTKESLSGIKDGGLGPRPDQVEKNDFEGVAQAGQKDGQYVVAPNVFNK